TAPQYRAIGELSQKFGRDYTELSTRQNVQLHWLQIKQFREVFAALDAVGLTSLGGCGDSVRNITGCPVAGLNADELFDCRPQLASGSWWATAGRRACGGPARSSSAASWRTCSRCRSQLVPPTTSARIARSRLACTTSASPFSSDRCRGSKRSRSPSWAPNS